MGFKKLYKGKGKIIGFHPTNQNTLYLQSDQQSAHNPEINSNCNVKNVNFNL